MQPKNDRRNLADLPPSGDEYWEGAETHRLTPRALEICVTHGRSNYAEHRGYLDNRDGTISCRYCPWGGHLAGYQKVFEGRIVDLRSVEGNQ